jgi:hypothetical protein
LRKIINPGGARTSLPTTDSPNTSQRKEHRRNWRIYYFWVININKYS